MIINMKLIGLFCFELKALTNPFIVNLAYHMKNNSYCFMVMEFITGGTLSSGKAELASFGRWTESCRMNYYNVKPSGEMFDLLQDNGPLPFEDVQFYMSNVILGFEYLQVSIYERK